MGSVAVTRITSGNYSAVDRVLDSPTAEIHRIAISRGRPMARSLMRFMATDLNREYYAQWERTQLFLGLGVVAVLFADSRKRALIVIALAGIVLVAFQHYWVTPEILFGEQVRSFADKNGPQMPDSSFARMKILYNAVEAAKLILLLALTVVLVKMQGREQRTRRRRPLPPEALAPEAPMSPLQR